MKSPSRNQGKQVQLTVFNNELLARLAEQRLRLEGIPSLIRSRNGGPGLWGSAYNLPHGLYVFQSDEMKARDILDLVPLEVAERAEAAGSESRHQNRAWIIVAAIVIVSVLVVSAPAFVEMFK